MPPSDCWDRKFFNFCFNKMHNYAFLKRTKQTLFPARRMCCFFCKAAARVMTPHPALALVFLRRKSRKGCSSHILSKPVLWGTGTAGGTQIPGTFYSKQIWKEENQEKNDIQKIPIIYDIKNLLWILPNWQLHRLHMTLFDLLCLLSNLLLYYILYIGI